MDKQKLGKQSLSGFFWTGGTRVIKLFSLVVVGLILLRYLNPIEFGILAKAGIFVAFCSILVELGFYYTIVNKKGLTEEEIDSYFWLLVINGLLIGLILYFSSYAWTSYYQDENVGKILRAFAFSFPIASTYIVHKSLLAKDLKFRKLRLRETIADVSAGILSIILAINGWSFWSVVISQIFAVVLMALLMWSTKIYSPKLRFKLDHILDNWNYSFRVFGDNMINYLGNLLDQFIISSRFETSVLGLYNRSNSLFYTPVQTIPRTFLEVLFPVFSKSESTNENILSFYDRIYSLVMWIFLPIFIFIAIFTYDFVFTILGENWIEATPYIRGFSILAIFAVLNIEKSIMLSFGDADKALNLTTISQIINILGIIIGAFFSPLWILYGRVIAGAISRLITIYYMFKWYKISWQLYIKRFIQITLSALVILLSVYMLISWLIRAPWVIIVLLPLISTAIYYYASQRLEISAYQDFRKIITTLKERTF